MSDALSWRPTSTQVAKRVARLTIDASGQPVGDFSTTTVPTKAEVDELIAELQGELTGILGVDPGPDYAVAARSAVALLAASTIASSWYPQAEAALADDLAKRYDAVITSLTDRMKRDRAAKLDALTLRRAEQAVTVTDGYGGYDDVIVPVVLDRSW